MIVAGTWRTAWASDKKPPPCRLRATDAECRHAERHSAPATVESNQYGEQQMTMRSTPRGARAWAAPSRAPAALIDETPEPRPTNHTATRIRGAEP